LPADASRGTANALYADSIAPAFNPTFSVVGTLAVLPDTSQGRVIPATVVASPFVNAPTLAVAAPRTLQDSSQGSQFLPAPVPTFNPIALAIASLRTLSDTSQSSPQGLFGVVSPFSNAPQGLIERQRISGDTSQSSPGTLGTGPAPVVNQPTLQVDSSRPVADTSQGSSAALLTFVPPPLPPGTADWIAPAEFRTEFHNESWDAQTYPGFIPAYVAPPVSADSGFAGWAGWDQTKKRRKKPLENVEGNSVQLGVELAVALESVPVGSEPLQTDPQRVAEIYTEIVAAIHDDDEDDDIASILMLLS
jgi:hypothetical protein